MLGLVLASSLVSLLTLAVLIFQKKNAVKRKIPSALLGGQKNELALRLQMTPPPWLLWLLVILVTFAAAVAYTPRKNEAAANRNRFALLWLDNTLSSALSNVQHGLKVSQLASTLSSMGFRYFGLSQKLLPNGDSRTELLELGSTTEIEDFLKKEIEKKPSVFARPVDIASLQKELSANAAFQGNESSLVLITDAQKETMDNFTPLKTNFKQLEILALEPSTLKTGESEEIIPADLLALWKVPTRAKSDFVTVEDAYSVIPEEARPHLIRESFGDGKLVLLGAKELDDGRGRFPMLTACGERYVGPPELDPFADLRALGNFFNTTFREVPCRDTQVQNKETDASDPWKYRSETIWVVQAGEEVLNTLSQRFWIPAGFALENDALVYVASPTLAHSESNFLVKGAVQLDEHGLQAPLLLIPPPPSEPLSLDISNSQEKAEVRALFSASYSAADKTQLGFKAQGLPIFYLRTTAAMPNGELGRSSGWTTFWLEAAASTRSDVPFLRRRSFADSAEWARWLGENNRTFAPRLRLDETSLTFVDAANTEPSLGIYKSESGLIFAILPSPLERSRTFVTPSVLTREWNTSTQAQDTQSEVSKQKTVVTRVASALGVLLVLLFWLAKTARPQKTTLGIVLFILVGVSADAQAQGALRNPFGGFFRAQNQFRDIAVPYRVAWCDANLPDAVKSRYLELRDVLASRGTIDLPKTLLSGACRAGAAEVWWTNDPYALQSPAVNEHVSLGGIFILEGQNSTEVPPHLVSLADPSIGLLWEKPPKRGNLYRSFYLLQTFDGCVEDKTKMLTLRKKPNAHSPFGIVTTARFLTTSLGSDCFALDEDFRSRSFVNLMYSFFATDYKEDQLQLPEILNRVRNLGLEP